MVDDVHIGNNGALLDLADNAGRDDFLQAQRAANRKHSLALHGNSPACLRLGDGRGHGAGEGAEIGVENGDVSLRVKRQDLGRHFPFGIELNGDQFRGSDHVLVGHHETCGIDDETRARTDFTPDGHD